jgi:hypothetical protein
MFLKTHAIDAAGSTDEWEGAHTDIDEIPLSRWKNDESLSSGVWQQISMKLNKYNFKVVSPKSSLANHLGYKDSVMNKELRKNQNLKTKNFNKEWKI